MRLRAKFNITIIAAFAIGYAGIGILLNDLFIANARRDVLENARVMMSATNAVKSYTDGEIVPLLAASDKSTFQPAEIPFFAAKRTFQLMHKAFPNYSLAETALNPTNLEDRPTDWQADFIQHFRSNPGLKELLGTRDTPTGESLNLAEPISVSDVSCLACHSTAAVAPASMIAKYGSANGFGWKLHETVGAQVVSVPMTVPLAKAHSAFLSVMAALLVMFVGVLVIINVLLHFIIIKPVVKVAGIAEAVSLGKTDVEEFTAKGNDEIASLTASFGRMRRSLDSALQMLQ